MRYYGCPAEEGGAAKGFMVRDGAFKDVDIAISWHPASLSGVNKPVSLANTRIDFTFTGRASHAAAAPHLGRSALDAVELMSVGVNYMREHMPASARVHYAYLDAGGIAPNVVQARAKVRYLIRAADLAELTPLVRACASIADGAALMTETTVDDPGGQRGQQPDGQRPAGAADGRQLPAPRPAGVRRGGPRLCRADPRHAEPGGHRRRLPALRHPAAPRPAAVRLHRPAGAPSGGGNGSTDVGDVSWVVPTVQARGATCAVGTPFHAWQLTAQGKSPAAHKGLVHVAKVMAGTAVDAIGDPGLIARAKADLAERTRRRPMSARCRPTCSRRSRR